MDAEAVGALEGLAGNLHHDAPVDGFCHGNSCACPPARAARHGYRMGGTLNTAWTTQFGFIKAATSPPKSSSGRSMPSPSTWRTKPVTLIGAPTLPSASLIACETLLSGSWMKA